MREISNVAMCIDTYKRIGSDTKAMPFGRIDRERVLEAKAILEKLEALSEKKSSLRSRRRGPSEENAPKFQACLEEIFKLSSEFYAILPKADCEFAKLPVLDGPHVIETEMSRVTHMLNLETTERLLLAAQYRKNEMNPLDYIYRALDCHLEPMNTDDSMTQTILQYMYNSSQIQHLKVKAIYKVKRENEDDSFATEMRAKNQPLNRKLLWHGTKKANLFSIFSNGLQINPLNAPISGKRFGNGVYTSDTFNKSWHFTFDTREDKKEHR